MSFYLKNPQPTFVTITVGQKTQTISSGETVGPFDDKDLTPDIISKANRRIVRVIVPDEAAEEDSQTDPGPMVRPEDIEDVETEEL
ncbi:MAG: hypothetical protein KAY24_12980 [Candidatus Eisenbacteria sp.]|nr:hypothetical protein [Candidatus Eisenbacteria bacterium]